MGMGSLLTMGLSALPSLIQTGMGAAQTGKDNIQNLLATLGNAKLLQTDADILGKTQAATGDILNRKYGYSLPEYQANEANIAAQNAQRWSNYGSQLNQNYGQALSGLGSNETALRNDLTNAYGTTMGSVGNLQNQMKSGYGQQQKDVMGLLDNMGNAQRNDIRSNWAQQGAKTQQGLVDSGMGNTTIGAQMGLANTANMNKDLGTLEENLRTQKSGMLANLTGNALNSQQALGQYGTGMQSDLLNNQTNMLANQADTNWGRRSDLGQNYMSDRNSMALEQTQMADAQSQARQQYANQYAGDYTNWLNNNYQNYDQMLRNVQIPYSQNTGQAMTMEGLGGIGTSIQSSLDREAQKRAAAQQASATKTAGVLGLAGNLIPGVRINKNY
jgi:hypothetical protein